jgi:hypothetical protein
MEDKYNPVQKLVRQFIDFNEGLLLQFSKLLKLLWQDVAHSLPAWLPDY